MNFNLKIQRTRNKQILLKSGKIQISNELPMILILIPKLQRLSATIPQSNIHIIRATQNQVSLQGRKLNPTNPISMTLNLNHWLRSISHIKKSYHSIRGSSNKSLLVLINIHRDDSLAQMGQQLPLISLRQIIHQNLTILSSQVEFISIHWTPVDVCCACC